MFTIKDRDNIKKYLKEGNYGEILLICMMRNGATMDELQEMNSLVSSTNSYTLNKIIQYAVKYYDLNGALNDDYH